MSSLGQGLTTDNVDAVKNASFASGRVPAHTNGCTTALSVDASRGTTGCPDGGADSTRLEYMSAGLVLRIARLLDVDPGQICQSRSLVQLGLSSLMGLHLIAELGVDLELSPRPSELLGQASIGDLACWLMRQQALEPPSAELTGDAGADGDDVPTVVEYSESPQLDSSQGWHSAWALAVPADLAVLRETVEQLRVDGSVVCKDGYSETEQRRDEASAAFAVHEFNVEYDSHTDISISLRDILCHQERALDTATVCVSHVVFTDRTSLLIISADANVYDDRAYSALVARMANTQKSSIGRHRQTLDSDKHARSSSLAGHTRAADRYWRDVLGKPYRSPKTKIGKALTAESTTSIVSATFRLDTGDYRRLVALAGDHGVTLAALMLTIYKTLVRRYTDNRELIVSIPVFADPNRFNADVIDIIHNYLYIRTEPSITKTFNQYLHEVAAALRIGLDHGPTHVQQHTRSLIDIGGLAFSFWDDVEAIPELKVAHAVAGKAGVALSFNGVMASSVPLFEQTLSQALQLKVSVVAGGIDCEFLAFDAFFSAESIARFANNFGVLANAILEDQEKRLHDYRVLTRHEEACVLEAWNSTVMEFGDDPDLLTVFSYQAKDTATSCAAVCASAMISYEQLDTLSTRLALHLISFGAMPGQCVAICAKPSIELVIAILAVLKSGAAIVVLPTAVEDIETRQAIAVVSAPLCLLAQAEYQEQLSVTPAPALCIDPDLTHWRENVKAMPLPRIDGRTAALVEYDAQGLRGQVVAHGAMRNLVFALQDDLHLGEGDVVVPNSCGTGSAIVWQVLWPVLTGGQLVLLRADEFSDRDSCGRCLGRYQCSVVFTDPKHIRNVCLSSDFSACEDLRYVICVGDGLTNSLACEVAEQGRARLVALVGLGQPAVPGMWWRQFDADGGDRLIAGKPMANTTAFIVDNNLSPLPVGVVGEIFVGGSFLSLGYLGEPAQTAQYWVPDPFSTLPGRRLFRTGWCGRYLEDGTIELKSPPIGGDGSQWRKLSPQGLPNLGSDAKSHSVDAVAEPTALFVKPQANGCHAGEFAQNVKVCTDTESRLVVQTAQELQTSTSVLILAAWVATIGRLSGVERIVVAFTSYSDNGVEVNDRESVSRRPIVQLQIEVVATDPVAKLVAKLADWQSRYRRPVAADGVLTDLENEFAATAIHPYFLIETTDVQASRDLVAERLRQAASQNMTCLALMHGSVPALTLGIVYERRWFDTRMIDKALQYCKNLLVQICTQRTALLANLLTRQDRTSHESASATEGINVPGTLPTYTRIFEQQVRARPTGVAARQGGESLTYDALNRRSNRLARCLRQRDVTPNTVVAVMEERGLDLLVMVLAVLKAGGVLLMLRPQLSTLERQQAMAAVNVGLLLTGSRWKSRLRDDEINTVDVAYLHDMEREAQSNLNLTPVGSTLNAAYVLLNEAGGRLVASMVEHRSLFIDLANWTQVLELKPSDVVAQASAQTDGSFFIQTLMPLAGGACVDILPDDVGTDSCAMLQMLRARNITIAEVSLNAVLAGGKLSPLPKLRWLIDSNYNIDAGAFRRLHRDLGGVGLLVAWWRPECGGLLAVAGKDAESVSKNGHLRFMPLPGYSLRILDAYLDVLPDGMIGDVYVCGAALGCSYVDRPSLAAATFLPSPCGRSGERMVALGVRGCLSQDGTLELVGKDQGKLPKVRRQHRLLEETAESNARAVSSR